MNASTASPALSDWKAPRIALAALLAGLVLSVTLHLVLVEGLRQNRPSALQSAFRDDAGGIQFDCPFANCGPERLFRWPRQPPATDDQLLYDFLIDPLVIQGLGEGWATVRCQVTDKQYLDQCKWIDESAPGFGDRALGAMVDARPTRHLEPGSTIQLKVRFER